MQTKMIPLWVLCLAGITGLPAVLDAAQDQAQLAHFEKKVRPLLAARCWKCHGPERQKKGLRLDTASAVLRGSDDGPVIVAGKPEESRLIQAVRHTGKLKMPPREKLSDGEVTALVAWIRDGAVWPATTPTRSERAPAKGALFTDAEKSYWAFQPIRKPDPPKVQHSEWITSDVDRFILARLEARGLSPVEHADKRTLIRRVSFDLTGLPPTPEAIDTFLADDSPEAFSKVVDRLLDSPHYGERWARHWLSVVRYGDTGDIAGLQASPYSYRYRDYVVRAFNQDKPYDEFIIEQLAGDLLPPTGDLGKTAERVIATGFLLLGPKPVTEGDKEKMILEIVDEQIDVTSRAFLGLTVACARCHDHKFDPIPTEDYYSIAGIFYSTRTMADRKQVDSKWNERPLLNVPGEKGEVMVLAVQDGKATNLPVHIRGSHRNLGEQAVPRRFLRIIAGEDHPTIDGKQSGRLELARWIANANNPLTARVIVNRIWQGHFGTGLVATSDNFGLMGQPATHPELLDWLASRFVESGWSMKFMHRLLLNTSTYRLGGGGADAKNLEARELDPDSSLLWRMSPRRLEAEEVRDTILAASGRLDRTVGGTLFHRDLRYIDTIVDPKRDIWAVSLPGRTYDPYFSTRRSIYLPMVRQKIPEILQLFDFGDASALTTKRSETTVAPQALYLLNSPFVREQSFHLARELLGLADGNDEARVQLAHRRILGRPATSEETTLGVDYTRRYSGAIEETRRTEAKTFAGGATMTLTIERAFHARKIFPQVRSVLQNPSGVRLRISVTSVDRLRAGRNDIADWQVLVPLRVSSTRGAKLAIGPVGTVTIQGSDPTPDTYEISANTDVEKITAIRLEVFPDPAEAPERSIPDLFVVTEFRARVAPRSASSSGPSGSQELRLQHAVLKLAEKDLSMSAAIDADKTTSWPVGPQRDQPGVVILETEASLLKAWQSYCRSLFCVNEFVYLE